MSRLSRSSDSSQSTGSVFTWPVRVYWEDTDAGGVVYHSSYLRFIERARTEWLRHRGIEQQKLRDEHDVLFVVSEIDIRFLSPARLDDELTATIDAFTRRSASMTFSQCILRPTDGARIVEARVRAACINGSDFKPRRIPDFLFMEKQNA